MSAQAADPPVADPGLYPRKPRKFWKSLIVGSSRARQHLSLTSSTADKVASRHGLHRFLYIFYVVPLVIVSFTVAALLFVPWTFLPSTRPRCEAKPFNQPHAKRPRCTYDPEPDLGISEKTSRGRRRPDIRAHRDIWAPIGTSALTVTERKTPVCTDEKCNRSHRTSRSVRVWRRVWDMHCLQRECWHMLHRQGLQVVGVLCGGTLAIMQLIRMMMELSGGELRKYIEAKSFGTNLDFMKSQPDCAYVVGTGFANWAPGFQPFIWYTAYHTFVLVLCLMLIVDEVLNVRMGLFAPQWSRAGTGYTIMFLALCLINSSPNWGWKIMIPFHHVLLVLVFCSGIYNVVRLVLFALDCTSDRTLSRANRRNGRFPLRPWTEREWKDVTRGEKRDWDYHLARNREIRPGLPLAPGLADKLGDRPSEQDTARAIKQQEEEWKALKITEKWQAMLGDSAWELREKGKGGGPLVQEEIKNQERQWRAQKARSSPWSTLTPAPFNVEERWLLERSSKTYYLTEDYALDKFLIYIGAKDKSHRVVDQHYTCIEGNRDIVEPRPALVDPKTGKIKAGVKNEYEWETEWEFADRAVRNKKGTEDYCGNHAWVPRINTYNKRDRKWYFMMDLRRWGVVAVMTAMLLVHVCLLVQNLGVETNNWPTYNAQYKAAAARWTENGGIPNPGDCQYYQGSALPIWIRPGEGSIKGVFTAMFFFAAWELFIMHLCLGALLVALTNNRTYGMHLPWPITLIGPRTSSIGIGLTVMFVGVATLQMGLFHYISYIAMGTGYCSVAVGLLFVLRNERFRDLVTRRPFVPLLSLWAHEYMDGVQTADLGR